jgi:hypothetical protein
MLGALTLIEASKATATVVFGETSLGASTIGGIDLDHNP